MTTTNTNGRLARKSLASEINRLDSLLEGLAENLNEAVATAVKDAVSQAVREAVNAVIQEVLTNADQSAVPGKEPHQDTPSLPPELVENKRWVTDSGVRRTPATRPSSSASPNLPKGAASLAE
jgi:hypothetical protein